MMVKMQLNEKDIKANIESEIVCIENVKYPEVKGGAATYSLSDFEIIKDKSITKTLSRDEFIQYLMCDDLIVIPYCIDGSNVIFTVLDKNIDINNNKMAFFYLTQIFYGKDKLITINYETLSMIMDEIDIKYENILFVHNMGRCGSNLFTKLMLKLASNENDLLIINETNILGQLAMNVHRLNQKNNDKLLRSLLKTCIKAMIVGLTKNNKNKKIIFKETSQLTWCMPIICEIFPSLNHMYLYRESYYQIDSFLGIFDTMWSRTGILHRMISFKKLIYVLENIHLFHILFGKLIFNPNTIWLMTNYHYDSIENQLNEFEYLCQYAALHWISQINIARKCINDNNLQFCIKFNDLKANPYEIIKSVYSKLSWKHIKNDPTILDKVLSKDAHQATGGIQSHRKGKQKLIFLKQYHLKAVNYVIENFKQYDEINVKYTLPTTICI